MENLSHMIAQSHSTGLTAYRTGLVVLLDEVFIGEFCTVDGLSTSAITGGEVTTLKMKRCNSQSRYQSLMSKNWLDG